MSAPEGYNPDNLMGNVCDVLADRSGLTPEHVAHRLAEVYGEDDYDSAESVLWDLYIGRMIDWIQDGAGIAGS